MGRRKRFRFLCRERRSLRARVVVARGKRRERKSVVWKPLHRSIRRWMVWFGRKR